MPPDARLDTPRLVLRRLRASDEPDLVALDSDPEVMRYVGSPAGVKSPAETVERARGRIAEAARGVLEPLGLWRIERRDQGAFCGIGALLRMPSGADVEVAYRLARAAWGAGIATEAAGALVAHGLRTLALPRLVAVTYPENRASQRVLDKLGFERRGFTEYKGVRTTFHVLAREAWTPPDIDNIRAAPP
ncbi:MAG TPA: GNAT family N-acetyltransferase [Methylomirabilota bacterium]|nr:GNAT family N-acetyltransferase [Methylomirabilota bacterium]